MYSLLVLGIIPGTDIQISFGMWLEAAAVALCLFTLLRGLSALLRRQVIHDERVQSAGRVPLQASQLHRPA